MTFHDEVHFLEETKAHRGARDLLIWLKTIGPTDNVLAERLLVLARAMKWEIVDDEYMGKVIK